MRRGSKGGASKVGLVAALLIIIGSGMLVSSFALPSQAGLTTYTIILRVLDASTSQGISGANIWTTSAVQSCSVVTDTAGVAYCSGEPGGYPATFAVHKYGYADPPAQTITPPTVDNTLTFYLTSTGAPSFDFSAPAISGYPNVQQGGSVALTVQVTLLSGTTQGVTLSHNCATVSGLSCPWSTNYGTPTFSTTLNVITSLSTPAGSYPITITASSSGVSSKSTTFTLTVTQAPPPASTFDFSITQIGGVTSGQPGTTFQVGFSIATISGSPQAVSLTYSPSCSSCYVTPTSGTPFFNAAFYWPSGTGTAPGSYTFTVTATSGSKSHSSSFTFVVQSPPAFDFSLSPGGQNQVQQGLAAVLSVYVTLTSGTAQQVSLSFTGCPASVTCSLNPQSGYPTFSSTFTFQTSAGTSIGSYTITFTGTGGGKTYQAPFTLSVYAVPPPAQTFDFTLTQPPAIVLTYPSQPSGSTSSLVSLASGSSTTATVYPAVNGFPAGVSCAASPTSGQPSFTLTVSCTAGSSAAAGTYPVSLTVVGGGRSHAVTFSLTVATATVDFQLTSSAAITVQQGQTGTNTISVTQVSGTPQPVSLTIQNAASCPPQATCTLNPSSGTPPFQSTLSISTSAGTPAGPYGLIVNGVSGNVLHQLSIPITVTSNFDFSISVGQVNPITQGGSETIPVTFATMSGTPQAISISVSCPSALTCSIQSSGTPTFTAPLTVQASAATGTYTITISASGNGMQHQTSIQLIVTPSATCDLTKSVVQHTFHDVHGDQVFSDSQATYRLDPDFSIIAQIAQPLCTVTGFDVVFVSWQDSYASTPPTSPVTNPFTSSGSGKWTAQFHAVAGQKYYLNIVVQTSAGASRAFSGLKLDFGTGDVTILQNNIGWLAWPMRIIGATLAIVGLMLYVLKPRF